MTTRVTRGDVVDAVDATGTIQPVTTVQVGTQVSGTIKALYADFNTRVRRGQVILRVLSGAQGGALEPHRSAALRMRRVDDSA